jgi:polyhydroxybutyrate depolymerase
MLVAAAGLLGLGCGDEVQSDADGAGGTGGAGGSGAQSEGCTTDPLEEGNHVFQLDQDGTTREYRLHLPTGYEPGQPLSLVLNFHGFTSDMQEQAVFSSMDVHSDEVGYAVVYPNGIENSWNGGSLCCGTAASENIDDVGFARLVVEDVAKRTCIDKSRVYATGMSNGGFMSHRLGCEATDLVAGIAPVAGLLGIPVEECQPERPMPIIHFYGTADNLVPYEYADDVNDVWVDRNGCTGEPVVTYQQGVVTCLTHEECADGATVTLCSVEGAGHCWPGQSFCPFGDSTEDISANQAMWELFQQHQLP